MVLVKVFYWVLNFPNCWIYNLLGLSSFVQNDVIHAAFESFGEQHASLSVEGQLFLLRYS